MNEQQINTIADHLKDLSKTFIVHVVEIDRLKHNQYKILAQLELKPELPAYSRFRNSWAIVGPVGGILEFKSYPAADRKDKS